LDVSTGVRLHVTERPGSGTPLICLHGIWDDNHYFEALTQPGLGALDARPMYLVDHRGHGESSKPEAGYAWTDYRDDTLALIEQLGAERVTLVGHSLGALVSLLAAAELGERVETMVLEDPPLPLRADRTSAFAGLLEMKQQSLETITDDFLIWRPFLTREQAGASALRLKNTADGVLREIVEGGAARVEIPAPGVTLPARTLIIQAGVAEERAFGADGPQLLAAVISDLTIETIPETSHNVLREKPDAYRALLNGFFGA
jgi:pimeloyl-ACP methyl ester carboxylesterase